MRARVILVEPENEGNIGSIARIMKNFGFDDMWIINPKVEIGSHAKALASHADDVLENSRRVRTFKEATEGCVQVVGTTAIPAKRLSNVLRTALSPEDYACRIRHCRGTIGLVFGRESRGLSNEELDMCDTLITIPASKEYRTLNVAVACAVILYELRKHARRARANLQLADHYATNLSVEYFEKLTRLARAPEHRRRLAIRAFHNLVSRGLMSKREALLILGILRRACCQIQPDVKMDQE